jgi:hypothetical protein
MKELNPFESGKSFRCPRGALVGKPIFAAIWLHCFNSREEYVFCPSSQRGGRLEF